MPDVVAVWYEVWCDGCGVYLPTGAMPREDAGNVADRHETYVHGGIACCRIVSEVC